MEAEAFTLDREIPRQAPPRQPREPGPGKARDDKEHAQRNEQALHTAILALGSAEQ